MNVSELNSLMKWINIEVEQRQILTKYQALHSLLIHNLHPANPKQPFEAQKDDLINSLKDINLDVLTKDQVSFLDRLGLLRVLGESGVRSVEDILYKNVIDMATAADKMAQMINVVSQGVEKSNSIANGLFGVVSDESYETSHEILMRVIFTRNASMDNVIDFKNWGNTWYDIGRGVAMANGAAPEDVKVVGATKGSIVIELAVVASIATTVSTIIYSALKLAEKVVDIKIKAEQLRGMRLNNDKIADELEAEAGREKEIGVEEIVNRLSDQLGLNEGGQGDKIVALTTAAKQLVNFVEKGGEVDFVIPAEEDGENRENENLKIVFQEIRLLEKKLELLGYDKNGVNKNP